MVNDLRTYSSRMCGFAITRNQDYFSKILPEVWPKATDQHNESLKENRLLHTRECGLQFPSPRHHSGDRDTSANNNCPRTAPDFASRKRPTGSKKVVIKWSWYSDNKILNPGITLRVLRIIRMIAVISSWSCNSMGNCVSPLLTNRNEPDRKLFYRSGKVRLRWLPQESFR